MRSLQAIITIGALAVISGCTTTSTGKNPEWLNKENSLAKSRQMEASGMMPTSIDCMMDTTTKNSRPTYFVKIEYKPRPSNKKWRWGVGEADEMRVHTNTANREGLKRVQSRQMLDPNSGKKASCALWHR